MTAPIGPVQVIPPGLMGYFNLKNHGQNPDVLQGFYQPVLESRDWLLAANLEQVQGYRELGTGTFVNFFSPPQPNGQPIVVPPNEFWFVWDIIFHVVLGAGDVVASMAVGWRVHAPYEVSHFKDPKTNVGHATLQSNASCAFSPRTFFAAGTEFGYQFGDCTLVAPRGSSTSLTITRLRI
jgi:hypothetical protein